ncbi:MAG: FtsX-like permease family protein [Acidimicrobiales bacterium]
MALGATAIVLALTLVLAGVSASFGNEAGRTVDALHAAGWLVPEGASGPFMSSATLPASRADEVSVVPGAGASEPVSVLRGTLSQDPVAEDVNLIGVRAGAFTTPDLIEGRAPNIVGEATIDEGLDIDVGATVQIGSRSLLVVGRTSGLSFRAGVPSVYITLQEAQAIGYSGADLASAIVTEGVPSATPPGLVLLDGEAVKADLLAPIANARKTISLVLGLLFLVAALIIGSVVFLSALDRVQDFAVLKAIGSGSAALFAGVALQSLLLTLAAGLVGAALAQIIAPVLPMKAEIGASAYVLLAVVGVVVGMLASLAGIRRAITVDPALAFGGA